MQKVERSVRVGAPISRVYQLWRNFENFPRFMEYVDEVRVKDAEGGLSHWKLKGPLGISVEYDARITEDEPNRSIGWSSVDGNIGTSGNVTFSETAEHETLVHVVLQWRDPPAGPIGEAMTHIVQNPEQMLDEDLRRFKHWVEDMQEGGATETRVA